ncbi:LIC10774 family surface protein [Leptospira santarosai]|uniref:DUF1565 domain-containing protein n=1 Tax=Leptospira santarosai serovar Shermani str. LT 821 TaxID=758847 RepID=K8Y4P0_9LEPT|nr:DUF1565 domain-containing protein [Leptospira santarosai]EKT88548.1 hypothetical protein LSS_01962 [Leptospira santarosai serovar Shermani str. LT 821]EPG82308.1 PF07602 family protein [Leptospira santarosai serovar Shermani str. 1342KT]MDI7203119.1 DUF1565 domain-containing protein [Leptospira santarosai]
MKQTSSMCLAAFLLFAGCVGANDGNKNSSLLLSGTSDKSLLDIAANPQRSLANSLPTTPNVHYVDALSGKNSNPGTSLAPYKTITYAVSQPGNTIYVAPGIYNEALGETFPIRIPAGMNLIGNESGKGIESKVKGGNSGYSGTGILRNEGPTLIFGVGVVSTGLADSAALTLGNNSTVAGFTITSPGPYPGGVTLSAVHVPGAPSGVSYVISGITIRNNTLTGTVGGAGIYINFSNQAGTGNIISGNTIVSNYFGIYNHYSNTVIKVENNLISQNKSGISLIANTDFNTNADLGGGSTGSVGNNTITCNEFYDLSTSTSNTIILYAKNNHWDHTPPTVLMTGGAADIQSSSSSSIFTSGMSLGAPHCNP